MDVVLNPLLAPISKDRAAKTGPLAIAGLYLLIGVVGTALLSQKK